MRTFRLLLVLFSALVVACQISFAQKTSFAWLPITQEDRQIKDVPGTPGAAAIQLYYSYYRDDNDEFVSEYRRIKILNEAGKRYADVKIEVDPGVSLAELAARTVHPDGTVAEFKGKPFDKTILKARGLKFAAKTFTLPEVTTGSIVEYRYKLTWHSHFVTDATWDIQSELYTVKAAFRYRAYQGFVRTFGNLIEDSNRSRVAYTYVNQMDLRVPAKKSGNLVELELTNIRPFNAEESMPPEGDYTPAVIFYYGSEELASPEQFWQWISKIWPEAMEKFIGNHREIREKAEQLTAGETDPEKKLRKLYAAVQQIRNLSYERARTEEEMKKETLKPNRNVVDVLAHGYGDADEIDRLFVALARAAGFEASVLQVSDRRHRTFNKLVLSLRQLDAEAASVTVNGKDVVLDPGTRFCPYGRLRWRKTSVQALKLGQKSAEFVTTPPPERSVMRRRAQATLFPDGALKGEFSVEMNGDEALEHRLEALGTDEAGRLKMLEEEVQAWLPPGTVVKVLDSNGWNEPAGPLTARFSFEIRDFASLTGKRLIAPSVLFADPQRAVFKREFRRYPIAFAYPFAEDDIFVMKLPDGYSLEAPPYRRKAGVAYAGYEVSSSLNENKLSTTRLLRFDEFYLPPEKYEELRNFYSIVLAGDGGHAVLRAETGHAASIPIGTMEATAQSRGQD
ncbi:MAG TPA: DUF3857 domain-containing protein [Alphaproteobacteria bacterium]|nr:DUF3857 domain-containing protein [Alphaproteobacteria bacterium]